MVDWILRPLTEEDIRPLWRNCYSERDFAATRAQLLNSLTWQESGRRVYLVIDVTDQGVVGAGHVGRYGRKAEIADVIVGEAWRGHGLGTALVQELCDIAEGKGWRPLEIGVLETNQNALRLYQRLGFRQVEVVRLMRGETALILNYKNKGDRL